MLDEAVRQDHRAQPEPALVEQPGIQQELLDLAAEAADRALLDRDHELVVDRQLADQLLVERLGEAGICDRGRQAAGGQLVGRAQAFLQPGAIGQERDRPIAGAHDPALADLERRADLGQIDPDALAAREAQGGRPVVEDRHGRHHVHQLGLVGRRHQDEARQAAEIGDIVGAGMGRPVGADQPGPVQDEADRQALDRDVMHDLVVGPLQEGRVDGAKRLVALGRKAGGEGHRMLLGDADIEGALGVELGKGIDAGAGRHRRGDRDDPAVGLGRLAQSPAEHRGIGRRVRLVLELGAGRGIELDDTMILIRRAFRRRIARPLAGPDMDQDRAGAVVVADIAQDRQQMVQIMAVDRADIVEAQLLEQRAAGDQAAGILLGLLGRRRERPRHMAGQLLGDVAEGPIRVRRDHPGEVVRHGADRRRDRHVVVVQDHDQP